MLAELVWDVVPSKICVQRSGSVPMPVPKKQVGSMLIVTIEGNRMYEGDIVWDRSGLQSQSSCEYTGEKCGWRYRTWLNIRLITKHWQKEDLLWVAIVLGLSRLNTKTGSSRPNYVL